MQPLNLNDVFLYVEDNIGDFHNRKLLSLRNLKLEKILKRKNPYLFKAKNVIPQELTKGILDAHLSSQEETIFGGFLEGLAIFVCGKVWNGRKSSAEGIDLEFERDNKHYIVIPHSAILVYCAMISAGSLKEFRRVYKRSCTKIYADVRSS